MVKTNLEKMREYVDICSKLVKSRDRKKGLNKFIHEDFILENKIKDLEKKKKYLQNQTPFIDGHKYSGISTNYTKKKLRELKKKILFLKDDFWKNSFLFDTYFLDNLFFTSEEGTHFTLEFHYHSSFSKFDLDKLIKNLEKELGCKLDHWNISVGYNQGAIVWIRISFIDESLIKKLKEVKKKSKSS